MLGLLVLRKLRLTCLICVICEELGSFFGLLWNCVESPAILLSFRANWKLSNIFKKKSSKKKITLEITNKFTSGMILPKADFKGDFEKKFGGPKFHLNF